MSNIKSFDNFNEEKKWIKDAIKNPGSLRKSLGKKKGEKIYKSEILSEISKIKKKDKDKDKPGIQLDGEDKKKYKRLLLARTLKSMKEYNETQNYMFFSNLENLKKMVNELSEMDQEMIDKLLSEHDWASDHMSVATENLEHLYNFFSGMEYDK